jgi:hypothetical protein
MIENRELCGYEGEEREWGESKEIWKNNEPTSRP